MVETLNDTGTLYFLCTDDDMGNLTLGYFGSNWIVRKFLRLIIETIYCFPALTM